MVNYSVYDIQINTQIKGVVSYGFTNNASCCNVVGCIGFVVHALANA
jgi:hypothetical protein